MRAVKYPWLSPALALGVLALLLCLPLFKPSGYVVTLLSQMGIAILFALAYNVLFGQTGLLSFGHAVYYGVAGFLAMHALNAIGSGALRLPLELLPLVGGVAAMGVALVLGYAATRRGGLPFAMITMGMAEMVATLALKMRHTFGGEAGISGERMVSNTLTGFSFGPAIQVYYLIVVWVFICALLMYLQTQTALGRAANAVRDNPERAQFIGYDPSVVRYRQFLVSAFFSGVAGGLFAINYEIATQEILGERVSSNVLFAAYIGGIGYFYGPILGAALVTLMQQVLSRMTEAWLLYFGVFFMLVVLYAPKGLAGLIDMHRPIWRAGRLGRLLPCYARASIPLAAVVAALVLCVELIYHKSNTMTASKPIFGSISPDSPVLWLSIVMVAGVGAFGCRRTFRSTKERWETVMHEISSERQP